MTYIAFLLGVNIGKRQVKMELLRSVMEKAGYRNVCTLIASGNLIFDTNQTDKEKLRLALEILFQETFGFEIPTILRTKEQIARLVLADPFKKISVSSETRLYVTFMGDTQKETNLKLPYESPNKDFRILERRDDAICSVLTLSNGRGSVDAMNILEKEYGKNVTTRNWNTIEKLAAMV